MIFGKSSADYQQSKNLAAEGKWEKALEKIKSCLSQEPDNKKYQKLFDEIILNQKALRKLREGEELLRRGHFREAVETFKSVLNRRTEYHRQLKEKIKEAQGQEDDYGDLFTQIQHFYQQEKYTKAKAVGHKILEKIPHHQPTRELIQAIENKEKAQMLYSEAMALYKKSLFDSALKKVIQCLQYDQDFDAARLLLAKISATQTCENYNLEGADKKKTKLQETIQWLESSIELFDE